jgi:AcrR family transcriptional regulator
MARPRSIPDPRIHAATRRLLAEGGDKAVSFAAVAQATGLAAPTLVQRYGSRDGMVKAALLDAWDGLEAATAAAASAAETPQGFLKALGSDGTALAHLSAGFRDADLRDRAAAWRRGVEAVLARQIGGGGKAREAAAMLFAAWQGAQAWEAAGGRGFKMKDAVKRLG